MTFYRRIIRAGAPGLLALLALAACASPGAPATPTAAPPAPTAQPIATAVPTAAPEPTAAPTVAPTVAPTTAAEPTAAPTATPAPAGLLPLDEPWVQAGDRIAAQGTVTTTVEAADAGWQTPLLRVKVAPDGKHLAYLAPSQLGSRLLLVDLTARQPAIRELSGGAVDFTFSPDGAALALTELDEREWRLRRVDLANGQERVLQRGPMTSAKPGPAAVLKVVDWPASGITVEEIFWATDGPPSNLQLVDQASGALKPLSDGPHILAASSPDGAKIALVNGEMPIGEQPQAKLDVIDTASGARQTILSRPGIVRALRWSPDGATLLYAFGETYQTPVISVVAVKPNGSNEQRVDFGVQGFALSYQDIAWRDAATPLVLVSEEDGLLHLYALPLSSFDATGLRPIAATLPTPSDALAQIAYVPR